ncbi:hypothetical protein EVAR_71646_1 [Eumeta japonica]|uniref:Uncharacterized protein n=1 Tax=Eumeta variegata TaxID=151549 RepID=A0A4C1TJ34_EUMVA|nr:hypothetical protein EVAR_71646_1 [Eumeta japonica]
MRASPFLPSSLPEVWLKADKRSSCLNLTATTLPRISRTELQNLFTTSHHVSAAQAPQPMVGKVFALGVILDNQPSWYRFDPRVKFE